MVVLQKFFVRTKQIISYQDSVSIIQYKITAVTVNYNLSFQT